MFADLVGSTALQETLDAESVRRVMSRFYEVMRAAAARHGGRVEKFLGDGVITTFGVPTVDEEDALRAVRCGASMVADLADLGEELARGWDVRPHLRVGIDTGELVISSDGELVGDSMNTAARLQQAAGEDEVLLSEQTGRLVRHRVQLAPVAPLTLKGKAIPVRAWRLLGTAPPEAGADALADAALVGRRAELARIRAVYDDVVAQRTCRLVTVVGSLGIGKTRLAQEFVATVVPDAVVIQGRCEHVGETTSFLPVVEIIRGAGTIGETDTPETVEAKLAQLVDGDVDAERVVARTTSVLGRTDAPGVAEMFWGIRKILEAAARPRPLVVLLDDLHWAKPLFLDLIEHLVEWVRDAPIMLIALARPDLRETREKLTTPGALPVDVIDLVPLTRRESRVYVSALLGGGAVADELRARILDTAEGNPLFIGETLRMLVDEGLLVRQGDAWETTGDADVQVPPTIHALLSARLEPLRAEERAVIETASVIGRQFYRGAVIGLLAPPLRARLDEHLETLCGKEMIEPAGTYWGDDPKYRFRHELIRDAAYRALLKQSRAELHERAAAWLEAKADDLLGDHDEIIAYHLEQAHEYRRQLGVLNAEGRALAERASMKLHVAARHALARGDALSAANLLQRALARTERDDPELLWDLGETLLSTGNLAAAEAVAVRLAEAAGSDRRLRARTAVLTGELAVIAGTDFLLETIAEVTGAAELLSEDGDNEAEAKAHQVISHAHVLLGHYGAAEVALDSALGAARRAGDHLLITAVLREAPAIATHGPSPVPRASGRCLDVLRILRIATGNRDVEAATLRWQAMLEAMRGRFDPARSILEASRETFQELGLNVELYRVAAFAGVTEQMAGRAVEAERHLRLGREGFAELGMQRSSARLATLLSRALLEQGHDDEAFDEAAFGLRHAYDLTSAVVGRVVQAGALARRGQIAEALDLAREAVALAEPTDALVDKGEALLALAQVLQLADRTPEMFKAVEQARAAFAAKGHTVGLARVAEIIGEQAEPTPSSWPSDITLGHRPPERWIVEYLRRWATGDPDAVAELYSPDWRLVDHRIAGWGELHGIGQAYELNRSIMDSSPHVRMAIHEILAGDDRLLALQASWRGIGARGVEGVGVAEVPLGEVIVVESGLITHQEIYEPEAREELLRRFAELGGRGRVLGNRPSERVVARLCGAITLADLDEVMEAYTPDVVKVDHRNLGWDEAGGRDGLREQYRTLLEMAPLLYVTPDEVLACDDQLVAVQITGRGTSTVTGDAIAISSLYLFVVQHGRVQRLEQYEPGNVDAILGRYAEMRDCSRTPHLSGSPPSSGMRKSSEC